jgi:hypothetical protein
MTPKEKANELYNKMLNSDIMNMTSYCAKQCALIAVEELIEIAYWGGKIDNEIDINSKEYFMQVKQEIINL